jgi:cardiolipin synthase A/B
LLEEAMNPPLIHRRSLRDPAFSGGNEVTLLAGGDALFPAMIDAMAHATHEVTLATYIFYNDSAAHGVAHALIAAARRGVRVRVVVDGFGSKDTLAALHGWFDGTGVALVVFRPLHGWRSWLQPGQLRRLHQKLLAVDDESAFVGGINVIDDRIDMHHGPTKEPRLDFAVQVRGPVAQAVAHTARTIWTRAAFGQEWRDELLALARSATPVAQARSLLQSLRLMRRSEAAQPMPANPMLAAFVARDNFRQRRAIERAYIRAFRQARERIDLVSPYFYPGAEFRRTLRDAARRGVRVRLLLQGKLDYRIAGLAAQVLYEELLVNGVRIYEYTPAFLHAKVALVDDEWATVGSSNIDPLSLLLNLEANVIVRDQHFAATLAEAFEQSLAVSTEVTSPPVRQGWRATGRRLFVATAAHWYLRLAGITGRY